MAILIRKTQLAAKLEATEGTFETLAAADALRVSGFSSGPTIDSIERDITSSDLSGFASLSGPRSSSIDFGVELKGSGAAGTPPEYGELLKACGFSETPVASTSVTYNPISTGIPSISLGGYLDGMRFTTWGARGSFVIEAERGMPAKFLFNFQGVDFAVTDLALLTGITYDSTVPAVVLGITFTVDSYAFKINKLTLDVGNELVMRDDIAVSSGNFSTIIGKRRCVGGMDPELTLVAAYDAFGKWRSGAEGALSIVIGSTAGNICTITAPKVRYTNIGLGERNVYRTMDTTFELNRDSGDDELVIALT